MTQTNLPLHQTDLATYLENLPRTDLVKLATQLNELEFRQRYRLIDFRFPDTGEFRRELYTKHLEFFAAGNDCLIRGLIGGNGSWKTSGFGCEFVYHLTGQYPHWWEGKRFTKPITAWAVALEAKQLRDGMQPVLFGKFTDLGSGLIPKETLLNDKGEMQTWAMSGTAQCIGTTAVKHYTNGVFDGWSTLQFKTAEQGWEAMAGGTVDVVWLDEEPKDGKVVSECFARTRGPKGLEGIMVCTFTPLLGYTNMYLDFLPNGKLPPNGINPENPDQKAVLLPLVDEAAYARGEIIPVLPHVSERQIRAMIQKWKQTDPGSVKARLFGIAALGTGRIYPIDEDFVVVPDKQIPPYWKKAYGLDPGWNNTAVIWIAQDPNTQVKYIYSEYKHGQVVYPIHVEAIKYRGLWMNGGIDPHEAGKPRDDGARLIDYFTSLGLNLVTANGEPNAARAMILSMFESGALKIMESCKKLLDEIRMYRYDENDPNKPAKKQDDHLCDAMMYGLISFDHIAQSYLEYEEEAYQIKQNNNYDDDQGRSSTTGY